MFFVAQNPIVVLELFQWIEFAVNEYPHPLTLYHFGIDCMFVHCICGFVVVSVSHFNRWLVENTTMIGRLSNSCTKYWFYLLLSNNENTIRSNHRMFSFDYQKNAQFIWCEKHEKLSIRWKIVWPFSLML